MFNWKQEQEQALERKLRHEKSFAKLDCIGTIKDEHLKHPDEKRDAEKSTPDYTKLKLRITAKHNKDIQQTLERRTKIGRKQ